MPTVAEAVNAASLKDPLLQGLSVLSQYQQIPFAQYIRYVLPLDGYVFWLKTQKALIAGSLHIAARKDQREDETIAVNRVVFTTGELVQEFNSIGQNTIWVGEAGGNKFAFSQSGPFYQAAELFHYTGEAVYPALESQLVDVGAQLPTDTLIVSNSLPAWLTLISYAPVWLIAGNPGITLYPSFLVPDNLRPPYGTVHIPEDQTQPLSAFPAITYGGEHSQLATDHVRVTLYGTTNAQALAFLDLVLQYSRDTNVIGMMTPTPIVRDAKRTQAELGVIAMKKTIDFQVSYLQGTIPGVGWQLILNALTTILPATYGVQ
jgi:hypothetical protein